MSDQRTDLSPDRFRDLATAVAPAVLSPDFDAIQRKGSRRRARRATISALAVVAAVALAVSMPGLAGLRPDDQSSRLGNGQDGEIPDYVTSGYGITMTSPTTGYRSMSRCPNSDDPCEARLEVTTDGGRSWKVRTTPTFPASKPGGAAGPDMKVIGPRSILLEMGDVRYLSTDGGATWKPAPPRMGAPVASVTDSDKVEIGCPDPACARSVVVAIDAATGTEAPLLHQPPVVVNQQGVTRGTDGSVWVSGEDIGGRSIVSASQDGGRTWITSAIPEIAPASAEYLTTWDGRTAFRFGLVEGDSTRAEAHVIPDIARTDDGGRTWRQLPTVGAPLTPGYVVGSPVVLPDGRLALSQQQPHPGLFVSRDGVTFSKVDGLPGMMSLDAFPGGVLAIRDNALPGDAKNGYPQLEGTQAYLTTDGKTWRALPLWDTSENWPATAAD